jgi:hypothetical protein
MSKHTPGPWTIRESATHITVVGANNETIFHDDKRCPSVPEDARLVAAAPELLEALKMAVSALERSDYIQMDGDSVDVIDVSRAAIAKAVKEES